LAPAFPEWPRRGLPVFDGSEKCLRTSPEEDHMLGFFVACFDRKGEDQQTKEPDREVTNQRVTKGFSASSKKKTPCATDS